MDAGAPPNSARKIGEVDEIVRRAEEGDGLAGAADVLRYGLTEGRVPPCRPLPCTAGVCRRRRDCRGGVLSAHSLPEEGDRQGCLTAPLLHRRRRPTAASHNAVKEPSHPFPSSKLTGTNHNAEAAAVPFALERLRVGRKTIDVGAPPNSAGKTGEVDEIVRRAEEGDGLAGAAEVLRYGLTEGRVPPCRPLPCTARVCRRRMDFRGGVLSARSLPEEGDRQGCLTAPLLHRRRRPAAASHNAVEEVGELLCSTSGEGEQQQAVTGGEHVRSGFERRLSSRGGAAMKDGRAPMTVLRDCGSAGLLRDSGGACSGDGTLRGWVDDGVELGDGIGWVVRFWGATAGFQF
nr:hypothetical protein Iba_chr09dCG12400 [Ipomoea batatas]